MRDFKVAVTGGPKAGKSEFMDVMKKELLKKDKRAIIEYKCFIIPETAREIMDNLVHSKEDEVVAFQTNVFKRQLFKEKESKEFADRFSQYNRIIVTLCDRGMMDNKAYLDDEEAFIKMAEDAGTSEIELLDDYNLVLYLESSAKLDNQSYEEGQDNVRLESKEEAESLDDKTIKTWLGHRNIIIIPAEEDFNEKLSKAVQAVKKQLTYGRDNNEQYDISDYDTSLYETGEYPTITETKYYFPKYVRHDCWYGVIKRTYKGQSSYLSFTLRDEGNKGYITEYDHEITEEQFNNRLINEECYHPPKAITEEITYVYEDNSIYKIIKNDKGKFLEVMTGEAKTPKYLIEKNNDIGKLKPKTFQKTK